MRPQSGEITLTIDRACASCAPIFRLLATNFGGSCWLIDRIAGFCHSFLKPEARPIFFIQSLVEGREPRYQVAGVLVDLRTDAVNIKALNPEQTCAVLELQTSIIALFAAYRFVTVSFCLYQ